jgi:hypothetical protein
MNFPIITKKTKYDVLVCDGIESKGKLFPVTDIVAYNEGVAMRYKNHNNKLDTVYIGHKYRPLQVGDRFWIGKRLGNNSACTIALNGEKVEIKAEEIAVAVIGAPTDADCPGEDLSGVVRTDGLAIGYESLYESKIPWKWVVIIGVIVIAVIAVIYFIKSRGAS